MKIITYPLGQLRANCYFVVDDNKCLIIDPADEASFILEELQRKKLTPVAILATHGHFDHVMAAGEIQLSFKIPLYISNKDLFLIKRLNKTAEYYLGYNPQVIIPNDIKSFADNELKIANFQFQIIQTPGHTPGSSSFYFLKDKIVFTGDTLLKDGVGRSDFSYSSKNDLQKSLKKLAKLPKDTIIYPGHGDRTTLSIRLFNFFKLF